MRVAEQPMSTNEQLEKIADDTCAIKLQVMRMGYVPHEMQKCVVCQYYNSAYVCHLYRPLRESKKVATEK